MASVIEKQLHLDVVSFCYDWGLLRYLVISVNETKQSSKYKLGFGLGATFCALGWFWICTTAPLVHGVLESNNRNSSFGQQQIKKLHTVYVYRNICMIILRCSKMANTYHDIGSRIKHRRTGIDDQTSDHDCNTHTHDRATFSQGLTPR